MKTLTVHPDGIISIGTINRINRDAGKFFFSESSTRFFRSRYPQTGAVKNNKAYFITSEQFDYQSPRLYTLRVCDMATGNVDTVGEFEQYQTRSQAQAALNKLLKS